MGLESRSLSDRCDAPESRLAGPAPALSQIHLYVYWPTWPINAQRILLVIIMVVLHSTFLPHPLDCCTT